MSLKTWKKEFYPISVRACSKKDVRKMLNHTLLKWTGLLPKNRRKHGLILHNDTLFEGKVKIGMPVFQLNGSTCVLCKVYAYCHNCPLKNFHYGCAGGTYKQFQISGAVVPMIKAIKDALKLVEASNE